ncbi:MAG: hypothetical protein IJI37_06275 [Opitutales bacterium]|nr:hypothetical protein [Opitutales bacterium]
MNDDEQTQIQQTARLQADLKNLCRSMDEVKRTVAKIADALAEHRVLSAERAAAINHVATQVAEHDSRIKKLEASFIKLAVVVAISAGGATLGIDKLIGMFK